MAYGWFSPIKGAYPGMGQEDKTAPVKASDIANVKRGIVLKYAAGVFEIPSTATAGDDLYFALQSGDDTQAEFAGSTWYLPGGVNGPAADLAQSKILRDVAKNGNRGPSVTGLSVYQSGEFQTDNFTGDLALGAKLTFGAGGVLKEASGSDFVIGIVTAAPFDRYLNDKALITSGGIERNQGAMGKVIQFRTVA